MNTGERDPFFLRVSNINKSLDPASNEEEYYIEGFASVEKIDLQSDKIVLSALQRAAELITIPPYNKLLLVSHDKPGIPIGLITRAEVREKDGKNALWIQSKLNQALSNFSEIWGSIVGKFLDAFSISGKCLHAIIRHVQDGNFKEIDDLKPFHVVLCGQPINDESLLTNFFKKAFDEIIILNKSTEAQKMDEPIKVNDVKIDAVINKAEPDKKEEQKPEEPPKAAEEVKEEPKKEEQKAEPAKEEPKPPEPPKVVEQSLPAAESARIDSIEKKLDSVMDMLARVLSAKEAAPEKIQKSLPDEKPKQLEQVNKALEDLTAKVTSKEGAVFKTVDSPKPDSGVKDGEMKSQIFKSMDALIRANPSPQMRAAVESLKF